jgi:hypothetical protein
MESCDVSLETYSKIRIEISMLHKLLDTYCDLFEQVRTREPTQIELIGIAGILHSFYSGFENIFKRIAQDIDKGQKKTDSWHADLLETMIVSTPKRSSVITEDLKERLQSYLSFRHVFRSLYSYNLNWSKMQDLVFESEKILQLVEAELNEFMNNNI